MNATTSLGNGTSILLSLAISAKTGRFPDDPDGVAIEVFDFTAAFPFCTAVLEIPRQKWNLFDFCQCFREAFLYSERRGLHFHPDS